MQGEVEHGANLVIHLSRRAPSSVKLSDQRGWRGALALITEQRVPLKQEKL
ncbi:hypothetical protein C4J88_3539 [Pseudomonas sp. R4-39-08]|uniref:hypothetical protein n=1 Tax=Pseudomonas sp. R4-39-08 TaxID=1173288 RepID=UPI000F6D1803|nr:hypothetical protein [Pseudomonas sp. R4-39-08]AZF38312.1 hypothetical protein C4J88_3539 [Pseudomonas sp. R4-39-08]